MEKQAHPAFSICVHVTGRYFWWFHLFHATGTTFHPMGTEEFMVIGSLLSCAVLVHLYLTKTDWGDLRAWISSVTWNKMKRTGPRQNRATLRYEPVCAALAAYPENLSWCRLWSFFVQYRDATKHRSGSETKVTLLLFTPFISSFRFSSISSGDASISAGCGQGNSGGGGDGEASAKQLHLLQPFPGFVLGNWTIGRLWNLLGFAKHFGN